MAKHVGIVACSAEGAALCYRTLCSVMFNHASSGHPGGSISSGRIVQSLVFNHGLATDARYRAADWLTEQAAPGSVVELGPRAPYLDPGRFQLVKRWRDPKDRTTFMAWRDRLESHEPYQRIRAALTGCRGRVVDHAGAPMPGLVVALYRFAPDSIFDQVSFDDDEAEEPARIEAAE